MLYFKNHWNQNKYVKIEILLFNYKLVKIILKCVPTTYVCNITLAFSWILTEYRKVMLKTSLLWVDDTDYIYYFSAFCPIFSFIAQTITFGRLDEKWA